MTTNAHRLLADRLNALSPGKLAELKARANSARMSGSALVAEALRCCGIKRVFGIAGTPVDRVFSECAARGIRLIGTRHQQAAVLAAAAGNFVAGKLESAVVVSAGPAVTNTLTGLLVARDNGWPVMVLGGRRPLSQDGTGCFQEFNALPVVGPLTKWCGAPRSAGELTDHVFHACEAAMTGRPGPVYLDLAEDVLTESSQAADRPAPVWPPPAEMDPKLVKGTADRVAEARRPLLIAGDGLIWSRARGGMERLVNENGLPFITTSMARGLLPDDHPLCGNAVRHWIQGQADLVVLAGAEFDWRFRFGAELARNARVVQVDLQSSMTGINVVPEIGVCADPGDFLRHLADALDVSTPDDRLSRLATWHEALKRSLGESRLGSKSWLEAESDPMLPQQLFRAIREFIPPDAIVSVEGNVSLSTAQKILEIRQPASWLDPGWNGLIGGAIPFALGAKLATPHRMVVALCSDTGFGMSAPELETAVRHDIPILVIIANNDGNTGAVRQKMLLPDDYPERFSTFLPCLRYERIMEMFGGHAEWITQADELRPALERAVASGKTACINVSLDPHAPHPGFW